MQFFSQSLILFAWILNLFYLLHRESLLEQSRTHFTIGVCAILFVKILILLILMSAGALSEFGVAIHANG